MIDANRQLDADSRVEESQTDFLGFLWRFKLWIVLGCLLGSTGGYLHFCRQPAVYESTIRLLLVQQNIAPIAVKGLDPGILDDGIETQIAIITSPLILEPAISKFGLDELEQFQEPTAMQKLYEGLKVESSGRSNILRISYRSGDDRETARVLDAVVASYKNFLGELHNDVSSETVQLIERARLSLEKDLAEKEDAYLKFQQQSPLIFASDQDGRQHDQELIISALVKQRSQVLVERTTIQAKLKAVEAAASRKGSVEALTALAETFRDEDGASGQVSRILLPLWIEEQILLASVGQHHPKAAEIRKRIEVTQELYSEFMPKRAGSNPATASREFVEHFRDTLRQQLSANIDLENSINESLQQEQDKAEAMLEYVLQDQTLKDQIGRTKRLFDSVLSRLEEVSLVKDQGAFTAQQLDPAMTGVQVAPKLGNSLIQFGLVGLFSGLMMSYLIQLADKSFKNPEDILNEVGVPVIGHIPILETIKTDLSDPLDSRLVVHHQPKSSMAEAFRSIRTSLIFNIRGLHQSVLQVTSAEPGDGKSTLAGNLAISIANTGKTVLIVDCDFRRPRVHTIYGIANTAGVCDVLQGKARLENVIIGSGVSGLSILPCGPRPENPSELLTKPEFSELIANLRGQFDYVLMDSPPVLAVSDATIVAPRADGVIFTMQLQRKSRQSTRQAFRNLRNVGANVIGVVVNGHTGDEMREYSDSYHDDGLDEPDNTQIQLDLNRGSTENHRSPEISSVGTLPELSRPSLADTLANRLPRMAAHWRDKLIRRN